MPAFLLLCSAKDLHFIYILLRFFIHICFTIKEKLGSSSES